MSRNSKSDDPRCNSIRQQLRMIAYLKNNLKFYNFFKKRKFDKMTAKLVRDLKWEIKGV